MPQSSIGFMDELPAGGCLSIPLGYGLPVPEQDEPVVGVVASRVPHVSVRLELVKNELGAGDTMRVRAGMELLVWRYEASEWRQHVRASADRADAAEAYEGVGFRNYMQGKCAIERVDELIGRMVPVTVVMTSTGILFGQIARVWHGARQLTRADIRKRDPRYLVLTFARRWWLLTWTRCELWVPVPCRLETDVRELADSLNGWLQRSRAPAASRR